jgi:hypothetical protein
MLAREWQCIGGVAVHKRLDRLSLSRNAFHEGRYGSHPFSPNKKSWTITSTNNGTYGMNSQWILFPAVSLAPFSPDLSSLQRSRGSTVSMAMNYRLDGPSSVPSSARFFSSPQRPDQFWGPPSLLSNGYRVDTCTTMLGKFMRGGLVPATTASCSSN